MALRRLRPQDPDPGRDQAGKTRGRRRRGDRHRDPHRPGLAPAAGDAGSAQQLRAGRGGRAEEAVPASAAHRFPRGAGRERHPCVAGEHAAVRAARRHGRHAQARCVEGLPALPGRRGDGAVPVQGLARRRFRLPRPRAARRSRAAFAPAAGAGRDQPGRRTDPRQRIRRPLAAGHARAPRPSPTRCATRCRARSTATRG